MRRPPPSRHGRRWGPPLALALLGAVLFAGPPSHAAPHGVETLVPTPQTTGEAGWSAALAGDVAVLGDAEPAGLGAGSAWVFRNDGHDWIQEARLMSSDGLNGDFFGWSTAVDGDLIVAGAATTWSMEVGAQTRCSAGRATIG